MRGPSGRTSLRRWLVRVAIAPFALIALWIVGATLGALVPSGRAAPEEAPSVTIGLLRGPIHYDFLLPLDPQTRAEFAFAGDTGRVPITNPGARWLLVGWGSAAFYTTAGSYADVTLGAVVRAATGDSAVFRIDAFGSLRDNLAGLRWLKLTPPQFARLKASILADVTRDSNGRATPISMPGFGTTDGFWQAEGHFDLFRTCNVWVGRKLRDAGLRFGLWTPAPQSVALSLWAFGGRAVNAP